MNLNQLRVFDAIAEEGSITSAARRLRISQPAVSKQLSELENALGAPLFDRLPRGVRITSVGRVLREHSARIFAAERAAEHAIAELTAPGRGRLSIGASTTIGSYLVPALLGRFKRDHPEVTLELEIANTAAIQQAVTEAHIDLGLTEGFNGTGMLEVDVVAHDEMVAIAPPGHPLLAEAPVSAARLLREPFLIRERGSGTRAVIEAALMRHDLAVEPAMSLGSTEAIKNAVASRLGVALVSRLAVELELTSGRLAEVPVSDLAIRRALHLVRLRGRKPSPAVAAFTELLRTPRGRAPDKTYAI